MRLGQRWNGNLPKSVRRVWPTTMLVTLIGAMLAAMLMASLVGCATSNARATAPAAPPPPAPSWQSGLQRDHPLVGVIWDVNAARTVTHAQLLQSVSPKRFVLLGERHDNPDHQRLALWIVDALNAVSPPALAMEAFDRPHQAAIDRALAAGLSAQQVAEAGQHDMRGWAWPRYRPLVEFATHKRLPLLATNLSRVDARRVSREGMVAAREFAPNDLLQRWTEARNDALVQELVDAHCGQLPRAAAERMALAQRARDVTMAISVQSASRQPVVLLAGSGHVRRDRAIPLYLTTAESNRIESVSIAFQEVDGQRNTPSAYPATAAGAFDYVWFTPVAMRPDPCASFVMPAAKPTAAP